MGEYDLQYSLTGRAPATNEVVAQWVRERQCEKQHRLPKPFDGCGSDAVLYGKENVSDSGIALDAATGNETRRDRSNRCVSRYIIPRSSSWIFVERKIACGSQSVVTKQGANQHSLVEPQQLYESAKPLVLNSDASHFVVIPRCCCCGAGRSVGKCKYLASVWWVTSRRHFTLGAREKGE